MLAALDRERRVVEQKLVARPHAQALGDRDVAPRTCRLQELEAERAPTVIRREHALRLQLLDLLELRLRLPRLRRLVAEPFDEALEPGELLRLPLCGLRLVEVARRLLAPPHVPRAREVDGLAALELEHRRGHRLEEPAVVCDEDHAGIDRLQHLLEPLERLDVEMVRRLVEQQQVRLRRERTRERRACELAAGERAQRPVEVVVGEAQPAHDGRRAVAPVVPARMLEPSLRLGVAAQHGGVVLARGHPLFERAQLALDRRQVGGAGEHVLAQRPARLVRRALVVQRDARALLPRELAALERDLARERAQQGRLPGAVRPRERHAVAALDLERDAVEEDVA